MISKAHAALMACYSEWMNVRLYAVCAGMPEHELYADRSAFFGSIYKTPGHIAASDQSFLAWFTGAAGPTNRLGVDPFGSFDRLRAVRPELDARLRDRAEGVEPGALGEAVTFKSGVDSKTRTLPRWMLVTHMFNHQTHHRGQVTTLLSQCGLDMGSTDVPFMPGFEASGDAS